MKKADAEFNKAFKIQLGKGQTPGEVLSTQFPVQDQLRQAILNRQLRPGPPPAALTDQIAAKEKQLAEAQALLFQPGQIQETDPRLRKAIIEKTTKDAKRFEEELTKLRLQALFYGADEGADTAKERLDRAGKETIGITRKLQGTEEEIAARIRQEEFGGKPGARIDAAVKQRMEDYRKRLDQLGKTIQELEGRLGPSVPKAEDFLKATGAAAGLNIPQDQLTKIGQFKSGSSDLTRLTAERESLRQTGRPTADVDAQIEAVKATIQTIDREWEQLPQDIRSDIREALKQFYDLSGESFGPMKRSLNIFQENPKQETEEEYFERIDRAAAQPKVSFTAPAPPDTSGVTEEFVRFSEEVLGGYASLSAEIASQRTLIAQMRKDFSGRIQNADV